MKHVETDNNDSLLDLTAVKRSWRCVTLNSVTSHFSSYAGQFIAILVT